MNADFRRWRCSCGWDNPLLHLACECGKRRWSQLGFSNAEADELLYAIAPKGLIVTQ